MLSPTCSKELLMLPKPILEQSLGAPAQQRAIRQELRHCPGRATRHLTTKAVICAVSEHVFEPRLADAEPHSAGLSPRASRARQVIWRATSHLLTICKPAVPRTCSRRRFSDPSSATDSTCSCTLQERTEEASQQAFQRLETWTIHHFPQVIQSLFFLEENDNKWGWEWKRDPMNGFHYLLLAYHQTNEDTKCIRTPWKLGLTTKLSCSLPLSTAYSLAKREALILHWHSSWSRVSRWPYALPVLHFHDPQAVTEENHKTTCTVTIKDVWFLQFRFASAIATKC